ncbi:hypothetical protein BofuT4_uP019270.1 [Botrytis cinerea T4]|uniref:Uncharacterized protein n=1 Tax=Botryotinia fuckeliana (strain T4) TaxID=999810 RepID=G2YIT4_BOTF4|nr:hypothetical protein BofuT4_uP019270.1 [Botrytis cinerea T4]
MSSQGIWGVEMEGLLEGLLGGAWGVSGDGSGPQIQTRSTTSRQLKSPKVEEKDRQDK